MVNLVLFWQFFKFGVLCFGGGHMIIPLLHAEFVEKTAFFTPEEFGNLLAISQMTPGAVSVNSATYVGYLKNGLSAAIFASVGVVFPTFILASVALNFFKKHKDSWYVKGFYRGARWASLVMILYALFLFANISIFKQPIQEWFQNADFSKPLLNIGQFFVMLLSVLLYFYRVPMIAMLVLAALIGFGVSFI